ncbi:MAG: hypothetical protein LUE17_06000 [Planctomycetaceae bacterium]|nr:hypothetical protein [Planctomycetaceae bacterium]
MPSVTLTAPVTHDDEKLGPGDVIRDLSDKAAKRLVDLGVATLGESVTVDDGEESTNSIPEGLSPEEVAEINGMKKDELIAALKTAGVACSNAESKPQLIAKLMNAWAAGDSNGDAAGDAQ